MVAKKENNQEDEMALLSKALLHYLNERDLTIQSSFIYNTPQIVKNKPGKEHKGSISYLCEEYLKEGFSKGDIEFYKDFFNHLHDEKIIDDKSLLRLMKKKLPTFSQMKYEADSSFIFILNHFKIEKNPSILDNLISKNSLIVKTGVYFECLDKVSELISSTEHKENFLRAIFNMNGFTENLSLQVEAFKVFEKFDHPQKNELLQCFNLINKESSKKSMVEEIKDFSFIEIAINEKSIINNNLELNPKYKLKQDVIRRILDQSFEHLEATEGTVLVNQVNYKSTSELATLVFKGKKSNLDSIPMFYDLLAQGLVKFDHEANYKFQIDFTYARELSLKLHLNDKLENKLDSKKESNHSSGFKI